MHIGQTNTSSFSMLDLNDQKHKKLEFIEKEKNLSVIFDNNLKFSNHIINQVNKANRLRGLVKRSCTYTKTASVIYLMH